MDIARVKASFEGVPAGRFDFYERRAGDYQLMSPILHEDGDMVDIYVRDSPLGEGYVRICDFGLALMRLSYTYDLNTPAKQRIFDSILFNNGVRNEGGDLYLDTPIDRLYESVLQFAGCVQKVCNMRYWSREIVRSAFYDDLKDHVATELERFSPVGDHTPLEHEPLYSVDWSLEHNSRNLYLFGVRGDDKAKNVAITLLEFQKADLPFISLVVHENMEDLSKRASRYLTKNADIQYPALEDFREKGVGDILRVSA